MHTGNGGAKRLAVSPVGKALWYIESHFANEMTLEAVANIAGVSRYHMTRAFADVTGHSLMRYVRGRRLTEAARVLAAGAKDILAVALDARYGSHEAFTRAFREQFDVTPETVRRDGDLRSITPVEPLKMEEIVRPTGPPVRFEKAQVLLIAGIAERYSCETSAGIPSQWQQFMPFIGNVPGQIGEDAYGVRWNVDEEGHFDYLCGMEVSSFSRLPSQFAHVRIPAQKYAVFSHREHVSTIRSTWATIWNAWWPSSGHELADAPDFERYGAEFDPRTGLGGLEIWVPIKA